MLKGKRLGLIVSGSIAAYKAAELVRLYVKRGARVQVAMTDAAQRFITPLTFQALSGNSVYTDLWSSEQESQIGHIAFADRCEAIVIAPASASIIAKYANGIADDAPTTALLAATCPVLVAPAMNVNMWEHPATIANVATLQSRGVQFAYPECGELACGWTGSGRLSEPVQIVSATEALLTDKDLADRRVIITAGPTQEAYDPIRFLSNHSTGKMGFAIAEAARNRGADVTLIAGPVSLQPLSGVKTRSVVSAEQMERALFEELSDRGAERARWKNVLVIKAAAVTDFAPESAYSEKFKVDKTKEFQIKVKPTPDLLKTLGERRGAIEREEGINLKIVGFCAETAEGDELLKIARGKLQSKGCDLIVANNITDGMGTDTNRVWLVSHQSMKAIALAPKSEVANAILDAARAV